MKYINMKSKYVSRYPYQWSFNKWLGVWVVNTKVIYNKRGKKHGKNNR